MVIRRGDIYYADLRPVIGSEQGGVRPVLVIQNRQQAQPDRDLRGDHIKDEQSQAADACGIKHAPLCDGEGFGYFTGTTPHDR